jgi:hypothetical protein
LRFVDQNGNKFPSAVDLPEAGDGITVFAVNDSGLPESCIWTLQPRGGEISVGVPPTKTTFMNGPSFFGNLEGFTSSAYATQITVGPQTSVTYLPPDPALMKADVNCVLIATDGSRSQSLYIHVAQVQPKI